MSGTLHLTRYNQPIPHMRARTCNGLRLGWLTSFLLATALVPCFASASTPGESALPAAIQFANQFANKIAAVAGVGAFNVEVSNRSSLDQQSVAEITSAIETQLNAVGIRAAKAEPIAGTIDIVLSENLREYVWTAKVVVASSSGSTPGSSASSSASSNSRSNASSTSSSSLTSSSNPSSNSGDPRVVIFSLPRSAVGPASAALPVVLRATLLFAQERPMLDVAVAETPAGLRLIVLGESTVAIYHQPGLEQSGDQAATRIQDWQLEVSLPITHSQIFPRDLRGRLFLRREHLFDAYLPGTTCRSISAGVSLDLDCKDASSGPWPLNTEDNGASAHFVASRNFFDGSLSPAIGKLSNVPSFYSAAQLSRSGTPLWVFAAVDGSLHLVDGTTDRKISSTMLGSDLAAIRSSCYAGALLLASEGDHPQNADSAQGDSQGNSMSARSDRDGLHAGHDSLRAYEILDHDPVAVSSAIDFEGRIVALGSEGNDASAMAVVQSKKTGRYEAYRVSVSCGR